MTSATRLSILCALAGVLGFAGIVTYLQHIQIGYRPVQQMMSELALGDEGHLMLVAFAMFAVAIGGAAGILAHFQASRLILRLLLLAAASLLGAGVFELHQQTALHAVLVVLAFVLTGAVMYLVPGHIERLRNRMDMGVSWGLCVTSSLAVSLGHFALPIGIAQRIAAAAILIWVVWLALRANYAKPADDAR